MTSTCRDITYCRCHDFRFTFQGRILVMKHKFGSKAALYDVINVLLYCIFKNPKYFNLNISYSLRTYIDLVKLKLKNISLDDLLAVDL